MKGFFGNVKGDMFGGLTAGVVALPLALAFGVQSGMGAEAGLYGAIFLGLVASIFGGTTSQISGPTGPMTLVVASVFASSTASGMPVEKIAALMILVFLFTGLFQIVFGVIKLGRYIKYIPYPVLSGFMSGIGIIIILLQIFPLFGLKSPASTMEVITNFSSIFDQISAEAVCLALGTLLIIYLFPLLTKKIPSTLVALIVMTLVGVFIHVDPSLTIQNIPSGLPQMKIGAFAFIDMDLIISAVIPGLTLAGLGSIDSLLTSVVADNITHTKHNSNRELIGQGLGNAVAGLFGGIPGAGATMRTVVNVKSGGNGRLSGVVHSMVLLLMLIGLGSYVKLVPNSVLAGILISVGVGIIDIRGLKDLFKIPKADAVVLIIVLVLTVFVDLLQAVGIGMVIASVLFMKRAGDLVEVNTTVTPVSASDAELPWEDEKDIKPEVYQKVHIMRLDGPLFFGAVAHFREQLSKVPNDVEFLIIRMKKVAYIDQSGLYAIEDAITELRKSGHTIILTMVQEQPMYMMRNVRLIPDFVDEQHVFSEFSDCAKYLSEKFENKGN